MDRLPKLPSVLLCFSLELAAKIVAYTHLVVFGVCFVLFFSLKTVHELQHTNKKSALAVTEVIMTNIIQENALLISSFFAGALVFGIAKKNSDFVFSWLLLQISSLTISVLTLMFTIIPHFVNANYIILNLEIISFIAIKLFAFLIVNSYYLTLSRGNLISEEETPE